ncbi:MAG: hypothetical protein ABFE01_15885, partial [Phycisphaerales bacterium]
LYDGPMFHVPRADIKNCPGRCLRMVDLRPCPVRCGCAFVREIIHLIDHWPKQAEADDMRTSPLGLPTQQSVSTVVRRPATATSL